MTKILEQLDSSQRAAAECLRGPVLILAGAGTGKTRTVTHRIAHGIETGVYRPEQVLAISFTNRAAGELQERLSRLVAAEITTKTFHSAALSQLNEMWGMVFGGQAPKLLQQKRTLLAQLCETHRVAVTPETLRDISSEIEWRKSNLLTLDSYQQNISQRITPQGVGREQLLEILDGYEKLKLQRHVIDYEDSLALLAGIIENEKRVAAILRDRFRYLTVDEYQDVSPLQHTLLKAWLGDRDDICAVGDASQTIFSFAAATQKYLLGFDREFPDARVFKLENNYRSTPAIITHANNLMRSQPAALELRASGLGGSASHQESPSCVWFDSESTETAAVAHAIKQQLTGGTAAKDIAVLARTTAQLGRVEASLKAQGIACKTQQGMNFFERAEIITVIAGLRARVISPERGKIDFQVVSDVLREAGYRGQAPQTPAEHEKWHSLKTLDSLIVERLNSGKKLPEIVAELSRMQQQRQQPESEQVTLSTVHAAKGLEWQSVYLIGVTEGLLPYQGSDIAEERRLMYVAITRAKQLLRLSGSAGLKHSAPSRFLGEAKIPLLQVT